MDRRCIICGLKTDEQCAYPRNKAETRRWRNLPNIGSFDVDTKALHLDTDQEYGSDPEGTPGAVCSLRRSGGKISNSPAMKGSCFERGWCQSAAPSNCFPYPSNKKTNGRMYKQNRDSMPQEISNADRCIGLHRCRAAQIQGNLYSQMQKNCYRQQSTGSTNGTAPERNLKARQPTVPVYCACIKYPITRGSKGGSEEPSSPLMRSPSPEPAPCRQRSPKNTQNHWQQRPRSCYRLQCFACNQQQFQSSDNSNGSLSSSTGESSCTSSESHKKVKNKGCQISISSVLRDQEVQCSQHSSQPDDSLETATAGTNTEPKKSKCGRASSKFISTLSESHKKVKNKGCQISIGSQLKDQEPQCSHRCSQPDDSLAKVTAVTNTEPKDISITARCDCDRSASVATKCGKASSKFIPCAGILDMPNFEFSGEEHQYSVNAVNVLLMNGSRQKPYDGPNPEICVQESDLADCNERAVFSEVEKPTYRVCRAATSGSNTKGQQDEANVLVLEECPMCGCSPEDNSHRGESEQQFVEGTNSKQNQSKCFQPGQLCGNWINSPDASNYTKLLELQRSRINELENLLQQHNKLHQTIQARMAELQCQKKSV